ncbi:hypothetical protein O3P69_008687 [Scylla paramamosain]|uniref:Uncharacterized protein n=1 Tax=Scylla paramamosain TaxID=85552 RepID=A0AAW0SMF6_SCYPA
MQGDLKISRRWDSQAIRGRRGTAEEPRLYVSRGGAATLLERPPCTVISASQGKTFRGGERISNTDDTGQTKIMCSWVQDEARGRAGRAQYSRTGALQRKQQSLMAKDIPEADLKGYSSGSYKRVLLLLLLPSAPPPSPPRPTWCKRVREFLILVISTSLLTLEAHLLQACAPSPSSQPPPCSHKVTQFLACVEREIVSMQKLGLVHRVVSHPRRPRVPALSSEVACLTSTTLTRNPNHTHASPTHSGVHTFIVTLWREMRGMCCTRNPSTWSYHSPAMNRKLGNGRIQFHLIRGYRRQSCCIAKIPSSLSPPSPSSALLRVPPAYSQPSTVPHLAPDSFPNLGVCDAEERLLSINPEGECWSEGMIAGKKTEGLRRNDPRELPARSGASIPHLRFLVWWMLPTRFRDPGTVEGISKPVLRASGAEGGQQKGDKAPDSHGRPWWAVNGSNSESGDDPGQCTGQYANDSRAIHDASTKKSTHNRSFDVYTSRRKKLYKSNEGLQRSVSIDQSRSDDDNFFSFIKYRDKSPNRGAKTETISSSSEDPAADLKTVLRSRPNKSSDRKRSSIGRRTEAAHKRSGGESSRSRRRQAKKVERSPSSRSSSSSRSGSATRVRASGGLGLGSTSRVKKNRSPKETNETFLPVEDNCKDDTKEFLRKLDRILTDLVENEKRKISSYGLPSVQNSTEGEVSLNRTSKKKGHKHKHRKANKERDQPHIDKEKEEASPSLQQLRATLRTVRLRKRPTQPTADVLDTHSRCFTEKQPHNPRILRSQQGSQLLSHRCYQPPRRRQPRSQLHDKRYPSDFCSSDEDKTPIEGTCQDIPQRQPLDDTNGDDQQQQASSSHKEDEDDICYGTDYHGSQGPPVRRPTTSPSHLTQRLMEAADSGDHSVDSAYTGSRGATPESILYPSVKPRRTGSSLNTPFTGARPRPSRLPRCSPKAERLQQLKRNILSDIREGGLYSDESINSLLEQYRRRYCHFSSTDLALVTRSIQDDLGVKPRPAEYLYQILITSEDDHSPSSTHNTTDATTTDTTLLTKAPSSVRPGTFQLQHEGGEQQTCSAPAPTPIHNSNDGASLLGQEEADEAWAKSVLGEVAPELVQEAKMEARQRHQDDDGDAECSTYVADLWDKFDDLGTLDSKMRRFVWSPKREFEKKYEAVVHEAGGAQASYRGGRRDVMGLLTARRECIDLTETSPSSSMALARGAGVAVPTYFIIFYSYVF